MSSPLPASWPSAFTETTFEVQQPCWDQRIPNEAIEQRPYLIQQPPIILQDRPQQSSNTCTPKPKLYSKKTEHAAADYWKNANGEQRGLPIVTKAQTYQFSGLLEDNPERPWVHGVTWNVDTDSHLRRLNYYNPKDCMRTCVGSELCGLNERSNDLFGQVMWESRVKEAQLWNHSARHLKADINTEYGRRDNTDILQCVAKDTWMKS